MNRARILRLLGLLAVVVASVASATTPSNEFHAMLRTGGDDSEIQSATTTTTVQVPATKVSVSYQLFNADNNNHLDRSLSDSGSSSGGLWILDDPSTWDAAEVAIFVFAAILLCVLLSLSICCCCHCRFSIWDVLAIFCCWEICCDDGRMISGAFDSALV